MTAYETPSLLLKYMALVPQSLNVQVMVQRNLGKKLAKKLTFLPTVLNCAYSRFVTALGELDPTNNSFSRK